MMISVIIISASEEFYIIPIMIVLIFWRLHAEAFDEKNHNENNNEEKNGFVGCVFLFITVCYATVLDAYIARPRRNFCGDMRSRLSHFCKRFAKMRNIAFWITVSDYSITM